MVSYGSLAQDAQVGHLNLAYSSPYVVDNNDDVICLREHRE